METEFLQTPEGTQQKTNRADRVRLVSADGSRAIQLGEGFLSINRLPPYISWEDFIPSVHEAVAAYVEIAKPKGIARIGLRYLNRVFLPPHDDIAEYFAFHLKPPALETGQLRGFIAGTQWSFADDRDGLRIQLGDEVSSRPPMRQLLLDLDYFLGSPDAVSIDGVDSWLADAHDRIQEAFESSITDKARELFASEAPGV
jgi:uncharacterized protein (TIGR04255 family)